ncbi:sensor histidine kinase [Hyalangium versicolor]|uniref:sensor histidine kinase n=1 Tax=Hyalangium versicolor TaxID=2861190 RepID=UPI001CC92CAE|nr:ATP-binding protein [Hyalangium versicolor]
MKRPVTLSARLTLFFGGAVLATILFYGGLVAAALVFEEWLERQALPPDAPLEDLFDEVWPVLGAMALAAPIAVVGAIMLGRALARRALAPMREASHRARAARASELNLSLPVRGTGDEWDELASTLNTLLQDARGTVERIRRFTADAAHELRTPLTVIIGETEVVLRRERSAEEYRQALRIVHSESQGLAAAVEALLMLSRADSGTLVTAREPVDLFLLAQMATQWAQRLLEVQARAVRISLAGESTLVQGDASLLRRVLENLLSNALRYSQGQVRVEVHASSSGAQVLVADDGAGVDPALVPRLFQRFARADSARSGDGMGLGLAISHAIIEAHGGALSYERTAAGESLFTFWLPVLAG